MQPILAEAKISWDGWYALRRGVATAIAGLSRDRLASKDLLRRTTLATTDRHYIMTVPENTVAALKLLETVGKEWAKGPAGRPN